MDEDKEPPMTLFDFVVVMLITVVVVSLTVMELWPASWRY